MAVAAVLRVSTGLCGGSTAGRGFAPGGHGGTAKPALQRSGAGCRYLARAKQLGFAGRRAPAGTAPRATGGKDGSSEHLELLEELRGMDAEAQMAGGAELAPRLTTTFLLWLSDLEEQAHGTPEGQELEELVQRLTAISLGATVAADGMAPPPAMLLEGEDEEGRGELGGILAPLAGVGALSCLTPEGAERALAIVEDFGEKMVSARRDSVTSVLGRVPEKDAATIPSVAGADQRILEVLLSVPNESWPETLKEACTPPDFAPAADGGEEDEGEEMMWTTPPRLLSVIDGEMRRLERRREGGGAPEEGSAEELAVALGLMLGGESSDEGERYAALAGMRGLVLDMVYES